MLTLLNSISPISGCEGVKLELRKCGNGYQKAKRTTSCGNGLDDTILIYHATNICLPCSLKMDSWGNLGSFTGLMGMSTSLLCTRHRWTLTPVDLNILRWRFSQLLNRQLCWCDLGWQPSFWIRKNLTQGGFSHCPALQSNKNPFCAQASPTCSSGELWPPWQEQDPSLCPFQSNWHVLQQGWIKMLQGTPFP